MPFRYSALAHSSLRLLEVGKTHNTGQLYFTVRAFTLSEAPVYTAVSYTWGDDSRSELIYLDGDPFSVRPNLWSCLYFMSREDWRYLWVDAICIDQDNIQERGQQVNIMNLIYLQATAVSVWLGLIPHVDGEPMPGKPALVYDSDDFDFAEAIEELANRVYWTRYWVIQEFLLAREVYMYVSSWRLSWIEFRSMLASKAGMSIREFPGSDKHFAIMSSRFKALPLITGRRPSQDPTLTNTLRGLFFQYSQSQCRDPRDRIFALLGLLPQQEAVHLNRYFPDYALTLNTVRMITLAFLQQVSVEGLRTHIAEALGIQPDDKMTLERIKRVARWFDFRYDWNRPRSEMNGVFEDLSKIYHDGSFLNDESDRKIKAKVWTASSDAPLVLPPA